MKSLEIPILPQDQWQSSQIFIENPDFQKQAFVIHRSVVMMADYEDTTSGADFDGEKNILKHL